MAGWGTFGDQNGTRANKGWVEENGVPCFVFSDQPTRVRFLTQDITTEDIMSQKKISREEAEDHIHTKLSQDVWIFPKSYWEHSIPSIPNKRFFSTVHCDGKSRCELCAENDVAKGNGVSENKLLPFSVRRRFAIPVWVYDLKMVLYVRGAEGFFNDVATYIGKHGSAIDFDIFKKGKGFDTTYHSIFDGKSEEILPEGLHVISPRELSFSIPHDEIRRRVDGGPAKEESKSAPKSELKNEPDPKPEAKVETRAAEPETKVESKEFTIPFGTHKGKTFDQLVKDGNGEYIKFIAENSAGEVQKKAKEFLGIA